jgi:hypothetical protein
MIVEVFAKFTNFLKDKKLLTIFLFVFLLSPIIALGKTCYVDEGEHSGDGSKDKPYRTISKALSKGCDKIKVAGGSYSERITIPAGVSLEGKGGKTKIKDKVFMSDDTEVEDLSIENGGIVVTKNAKVKINKVKIEDSHTGIEAEGGGKVTVVNSTISHNGKGLYLRYGTDVDLRNSKITHNKEEGVDIRANVDGIITGNAIDSNKEGGIEVIAGKSQLTISNNSIRYNKASGIAIQFYKENSGLGGLKIAGNTLIGNGNYGVDCKIPSGGNPEKNYWSKSVAFSFNKISGNGKGALAKFCKFSVEEMQRATKTEEEIKELERIKQEKSEEAKRKLREKMQEELRKKKEEEERVKREQQKRVDLELKDKIDQRRDEYIKQCSYSQNDQQIFQQQKKWQIFLFGPEEEIIQRRQERENKCQEVIVKLQDKLKEMKTEEVRKEVESGLLQELKNQQEKINKDTEEYKNKFGLVSWLKKIFGKSS